MNLPTRRLYCTCSSPATYCVDVGANVGSYTVLAAAVAKANVVSVEPDPDTMIALKRNIDINRISDRVQIHECALGSSVGTTRFTVGRDTVNKVASEADQITRLVAMKTLDHLLCGQNPKIIKLDVEGFEAEVLAGAVQTLANPGLLAVETEDRSQSVTEQLESYGFREFHYDPFRHELRTAPIHRQSNSLFVRQPDEVMVRVASVKRTVLDCLL